MGLVDWWMCGFFDVRMCGWEDLRMGRGFEMTNLHRGGRSSKCVKIYLKLQKRLQQQSKHVIVIAFNQLTISPLKTLPYIESYYWTLNGKLKLFFRLRLKNTKFRTVPVFDSFSFPLCSCKASSTSFD